MNTVDEPEVPARASGCRLGYHARLADIIAAFSVGHSKGLSVWTATTAGIVAMLLGLQFVTGVLLSFYYVPSTDHAHTTVSYIEKVLPAGSWVRALHHHGSQWLTLFLLLHVIQLFWRSDYRQRTAAWIASVLLLGLVMASGATGYSLPWDARAYFSTRVAEGIAGGLPLVGSVARRWLLGGQGISTLTLSRFFALHVLVIPALILFVVIVRLFWFRRSSLSEVLSPRPPVPPSSRPLFPAQLAYNLVAAGIAFIAISLYAKRFYAPFGPAASTSTPGYLPRPDAEFIWLYQLLKYVPGRAGSLVALGLPSLIISGLVILPFLPLKSLSRYGLQPARIVGTLFLTCACALVVTMTAAAYLQDWRDPRTQQQLARQLAEEQAARNSPFATVWLNQGDEEQRDSI